MTQNTAETDDIIGDLHKARQRLLNQHGGDLKSLFESLKKKQYESGHEVVDHIENTEPKIPNSKE